MLKRLDNIGISVTDLGNERTLFRDHLGMEIVNDADESFFAKLGDVGFWVFKTQHPSPQSVGRGMDFQKNHPGLDHVAFEVDDVDAAYVKLRGAGVRFLLEPSNAPWGVRRAVFADTDGNLFTIRKPL